MKVTMLTGSLSRLAGGLFVSVRELALALRSEEAVDISVVGVRDRFTDEDKKSWGGIDMHSVAPRPPIPFGYSPALFDLVAARGADILHSHGLWIYTSVVSRKWTARTGRPHMVSPHGMLDPWALRNSRWKKILAGLLYENSHLRTASCILALCEAEARSIRQYGLRNPICVIPNGIAIPDQRPVGDPAWKRRASGRRVLLYLGRLHPKKGLANLLTAWATVRKMSPREVGDWALVIAGWDQSGYEAELQSQARDLELGESVLFVGPQFGEDKERTYASADAFILPSYSEGLPMTILEAWAHGLPVMTTPQANLPEGFENRAAFRIDPEPTSIANGLRALTSMRAEEQQAMGQRGCELVSRRFNWSSIGKDMAAVYRWVLDGGQPPACVKMP